MAPGQSMDRSERRKLRKLLDSANLPLSVNFAILAEGLVYVQKLSKRIFLAIILIDKIIH